MKKMIVAIIIFALAISFSACDKATGDTETEIAEPGGVDSLQEVSSENLTTGQVNLAVIEVEPQCKPSMGFSFGLPAGWTYEITQTEDEPTSCISVNLKPDVEELKGVITIEYCQGFGVCGTGLERKKMDVNGYEAWQGFYNGNPVWEFIVLEGDYQNCVIINSAENWYEDYEDTINLMLSTIQFKRYE